MYKEYYRCYYKKILAKRELDNSLAKMDNILSELSKTVSQMNNIAVSSSHVSDKINNLIAAKIDLEDVIKCQKDLYMHRSTIVAEKLEELKNSKKTEDIIYFLRFVSRLKVKEVSSAINYTREYTYELISEIKGELKKIENEVNCELKVKN